MKRILCLTLALAVMLCSVSVVFADTAEQNRILLPTQEGNYWGGNYNKVYAVGGIANRMVTSYSVQPQYMLYDFSLGDIYGKDIRNVYLVFATRKDDPAKVTENPVDYTNAQNKVLGVYEITSSWTKNNGPLPSYNHDLLALLCYNYACFLFAHY